MAASLLVVAGLQVMAGALLLSARLGGARIEGAEPLPPRVLELVEAPVPPGPFPLATRDVILPGADARPRSFVIGADGTVWFTWGTAPLGGDRIGRVGVDGTVTGFRIPTPTANASGIAMGPDGNIWFTEGGAARIGRMTPSGAFTEYPLGSPGYPRAIAAGRDGNLWFTVPTPDGRDWIGRVTPAGTITRFPLEGRYTGPGDIAAGPDGNLWFSRGAGVGRITPEGVIAYLPAPTSEHYPEGVAVGPDRAVWFAGYSSDADNLIGRATTGPEPRVTGVVRLPAGAGVHGIATGPDGNVWAAEGLRHGLARITPGGQVTQYTMAAERHPIGVGLAPDGTMWVSFAGLDGRGGFARFTVPG
jgi:streptogramin lyase